MKKYIVLLFFTFFSLLNSSDDLSENRIALLNTIQREAENVIWHEAKLTTDQLQLLLNICCTSYAIVIAEHKLLQEAQFIYPMAWHLRYSNEEPSINPEHLLMLEQSLVRFSNLFKARKTLRSALTNLTDQIETEHKILYGIIEQMANHCTHLITYFAHQENSTIEQTLVDSKTLLSNASSMINMASGTYKSLHEGTYPFANPSTTTKAFELIETALNLVPTIANQTYETMQATAFIASRTKELQESVSMAIYN